MRAWHLFLAFVVLAAAAQGCSSAPCGGECGEGQVCDEKLLACVPKGGLDAGTSGCLADVDCKQPGRSICGPAGLCVACVVDGQCPGGRCDAETGECVGSTCNGPDDCASTPDRPHCSAGGACVACLSADDCAPVGGVLRGCDFATNQCVDRRCERDDECPQAGETPFCETGSGVCVECLRDEQCPASGGGVARCRPSTNRCVRCLSDTDCDASRGEVCDLDEGACVSTGCGNDAMCEPERCDPSTRQCVQCLGDGDCGFGGTCVSGFCESRTACATDSDCLFPSRCLSLVCVACGVDGDCRAGQACVAGTCREPPSCSAPTACEAGRTCTGGACVAASCAADPYEPNDDPAHAHATEAGSLSAALCPNEVDDFVFPVGAGEGFRATLTFAAADGMPTLELLPGTTPRAEPLEGLLDASGRKVVTMESAPTGARTVLVRVSGGSGDRRLPYALETMAAQGLCADDAREPDDERSLAPTVSPGAFTGTLCPGNVDWLAFDVPAGDVLSADLAVTGGNVANPAFVEIYKVRGGGQLDREGFGFTHAEQPAPAAMATRVWVLVRNVVTRKLAYTLTVSISTPPPANDACVLPPLLTPNATTAGTLKSARHDRDDCCGGDGPDVFYRLSLASASKVSVTATASYPVRLSLVGSCDPQSAEVACGSSLSLEALPAGVHFIRVAGAAGASGPFALSTTIDAAPPAPANESCASALPLVFTGDKASASSSTALCANDVGWSCGASGGDVVYALSLSQDRRVKLSLKAFAGASVALVPAGDCVSGSSATCASVATGAKSTELDHTLASAGEWRIVVDGGGPLAGAFTLDVELSAPLYPPGNDLCADAVDLVATQSGDTTGATDDHTPTCASAGGSSSRDVAYRLELSQRSRVDLSLAADFDAVLSVTSGGCSSPTTVACADGRSVNTTIPALDAGSYLVWVDGYQGGRGTFTLGVTTGAGETIPANDLCSAATPVSVTSGLVTKSGQTLLATDDLHPAQCLDASGGALMLDGNDVAFTVQIPAQKTLVADLVPAGFDAALYVLGACGADTCLAASDQSFLSGGAESVSFTNTLATARTVWVVVDSWRSGSGGDFSLALSIK